MFSYYFATLNDLLLFLMIWGYLISSQLSFSSSFHSWIWWKEYLVSLIHSYGCRFQEGMAKKGWWCCTTNLPCIPVAIKKVDDRKRPLTNSFEKNRKCPKVFNDLKNWSPLGFFNTWVALQDRMASFSKAKEHHFLSLHTCAWGNRDTFFV